MDRLSWVRDLVRSEDSMELKGQVDLRAGGNPENILNQESLKFLSQLKNSFVEASAIFNESKISTLGRIKIYSIAKTHADFMLFRNSFKMVFSMKAPGVISIRFNFIGATYNTSEIPLSPTTSVAHVEESIIQGQMGAFNDVQWTFQNKPISMEALVRYHFTVFVRESTI